MLSGAQKRAEWLHNPFRLGGSQCQAREQNQRWCLDHYHLVGPNRIGYGIKIAPFVKDGGPKRGNVEIK